MAKPFLQLTAAERKNLFHVAADEQSLDEFAAEHRVADVVGAKRAAVLRREPMLVNPEPIRPALLFVHKALRWFPDGNFGLPPHWQTMNAQPVVNERARSQPDRFGREDLKIHPGGRECLQVVGVGEETENLGHRTGQPELGVKVVGGPELMQGLNPDVPVLSIPHEKVLPAQS
jgi:hypothetical protein